MVNTVFMASDVLHNPKDACDKTRHLKYFRERGRESLIELQREYGAQQRGKLASAVNKSLQASSRHVVSSLADAAKTQKWSLEESSSAILAATYSSQLAMLELRNEVWPYEYMSFSRRIGELWELFIRTAFEHTQTGLQHFIPPLFSDVRKGLKHELAEYIEQLPIKAAQRAELMAYYEKVWTLVDSGEINLELDLHVVKNGEKVCVDLKSGFGSNEKGNMNRLLMVATIYRNLEAGYKCILLVRAPEDRNNNYFRTLRDSGVWEAHCGAEAYARIRDLTGFDLQTWISKNVDWKGDLTSETLKHFEDNNLMSYLDW